MGGKLHLKLNIGERPIANKYREGKMKSTLERELTVREIVKRETLDVSRVFRGSALLFCLVHFPADGSASILTDGKSAWECGSLGCVIALVRIRRLGSRNSARRKAGLLVTYVLRMLA